METVAAEVTQDAILSLEKTDSVPDGEAFYGGVGRDVYRLTHTNGSIYFTPGRGLVERLEKTP